MISDNYKILIITGCSKKKLHQIAAAKDLYQGTLFKKVKLLASKLNADLFVISAKFGLINANEIIWPYDKTLKTKSDIEELRKIVFPKFQRLKGQYDDIIIVAGKKYRECLDTTGCTIIESSKGYCGYVQEVNEALNEIELNEEG